MQFSEYAKLDGIGLAELVRNRDVTPRELLDAAMARADSVNPKLNAITRRFDDEARKEAAAIDKSAPFAGVPFLLKDLHLHRKGDALTNGSRLPAEVSVQSSVQYERFSKAGLVSFGRTASPEWGLSTATESSLTGATRNPWNLDHIPGGSSGGSAAAVAAGIVPIAHASDGGGSIRIPASCCGLFGLKPSRGRIPSEPHRGEGWNGMSTSHVVSVSVRDTAALLDATAGIAPGAPYAAPALNGTALSALSERPQKLRIALVTKTVDGADAHPDCLAAARDAAQLCESLGHSIEESDFGNAVSEMRQTAVRVISISVCKSIADYEQKLGRPLTEADVETGTWYYYQLGSKFGALDLARGIDGLHSIGRKWAEKFAGYDMVLTPTLGLPPLKVGEIAPMRPMREVSPTATLFNGYCMVANVAGIPAMSVPLFWNRAGLPIGAHFFGHFGGERALLSLAAQLEEARPWAPRLRKLQATL